MILAGVIGNNLIETLTGRNQYQPIPDIIHSLQSVPIGKNDGFFAFNKMVKRGNDIYAQKTDIKNRYLGVARGDPKSIAAQEKVNKQIGSFFGMASGCMKFLPMHISKMQDVHAERAKKNKEFFEK